DLTRRAVERLTMSRPGAASNRLQRFFRRSEDSTVCRTRIEMPVEQLHYGWARHGLEGRDELQIVGVTKGLADSSTAVGKARALLVYAKKADGQAPRSFGWVDSGELRFAFRRIYLGVDGFGRPGNFAAHVLVGPRGELSAEWLLSQYDG